MKNFVIGFFQKCDVEKFKRDFREGFWGVEASLFPNQEEVEKLVQHSKENGYHFGVHYPIIKKETVTRDPLFM